MIILLRKFIIDLNGGQHLSRIFPLKSIHDKMPKNSDLTNLHYNPTIITLIKYKSSKFKYCTNIFRPQQQQTYGI